MRIGNGWVSAATRALVIGLALQAGCDGGDGSIDAGTSRDGPRDDATPQHPQTAKKCTGVGGDAILATLVWAPVAATSRAADCVDPSDPPHSRFLDAHRSDVLLL